MAVLLSHLAADCTFRNVRRGSTEFCGASFPDLSGPRPPDKPKGALRPRIVGGRAA